MHNILERHYFNRPTLQVARSLLGKHVVRQLNGKILAGRIIEVEAYIGPEDRACHASKGRTNRTEVLFGPPGLAYVYLIYGMYHCLNVVTEREGFPAAVLIRAIECDAAIAPSDTAPDPVTLIDGPGRLCRFYEVDRSFNRWDLTRGEHLWIEDRGEQVADCDVLRAPRIGIDYAGGWVTKPWRLRWTRPAAVNRRAPAKRRGAAP